MLSEKQQPYDETIRFGDPNLLLRNNIQGG